MKSVKERIEKYFQRLSKSQQKVANAVITNPAYISTHTAAEVGGMAGVSETTVIRFCYAIGLEGFSQLQKEVTKLFIHNHSNSTLGNYVSSKETLFEEQALGEEVMRQSGTEIIRIAKQLEGALFKKTTKAMHEAKKIYVAGAGASLIAVQWLQFTLNMLRPNVELVKMETSSLFRTLQEIEESDLVIIISLHRYYNEPLQLAEEILSRGAAVSGITDSAIAPIRQLTHQCFVLEQTELSTIDLMPALITFLNALVVGMMSHDASYYNGQRVKYDDFQNSFIANRWR